MTLEYYFSKTSDNMTRQKKAKTTETEDEEHGGVAQASAPEHASSSSNTDPNILKAMDNITENITKVLNAKIDTVLAAIKDQTTQIQALGARVCEAEDRIASVETVADSLQSKVTRLEKQVSGMLEHIDDLDNRGRRCNVHLVGLPEGTEGPDPVRFIEKWLPDYLKMTTRKGRIKLDRAHRSMAPKPGPEQRSRPIILKFHNFADKQLVMNAARKLGSETGHLAHTGPRISFFNDFSAAVVKKRKAFDEIKYRLRKNSIDYALIYPATLKVMINGTERRFDTPEGAAAFAESLDGTN